MKKMFLRTAVMLLALVALLLAAVSCTSSVKTVELDKDNMPQTTFVQGNELDLSGGQLLVDGKTVPMDSKDVSITGYDKNTLGNQTLTITYKGKELSLGITVVPRMQTSGQALYFVGEPIDAVSLAIKITRDDGSTFIAKPGDDGLLITGFNSDTAQDVLTLTATYESGSTVYNGTFDVSVVNPVVSFKNPRKNTYGSHEKELDWLGASLSFKSEDGKKTRNIDIKNLTATGFDPTVVNETNPTAKQTISVQYLGREIATFKVEWTYSNVSRIQDIAATLCDINWQEYGHREGQILDCPKNATEEQFDAALRALELYCGLSEKEVLFLTPNEVEAIGRTAAVAGFNQWYNWMNEEFSGVLNVDLGVVSFEAETRDAAAAALAKMTAVIKNNADADEKVKQIYNLGKYLNDERYLDKCGELAVYQDTNDDGQESKLIIETIVENVYNPTMFAKVAGMLEDMLAVYDGLNTIPANWTPQTLVSDYSKKIEDAYKSLNELNVGDKTSDGSAYRVIEMWRADHDLFEMMYHYYLELGNSTNEAVSDAASKCVAKLLKMSLPYTMLNASDALNDAYEWQSAMAYIAQNANNYLAAGQMPPMLESTDFLEAFDLAMDATEELLKLDNEMYNTLFSIALYPKYESIVAKNYGYNSLHGAGRFDDKHMALWALYRELWLDYSKNPAIVETNEFNSKVDKMFTLFTEMMPDQQQTFLQSLNFLYSYGQGLPGYALFLPGYGLCSQFSTFIYVRYLTMLGITEPDQMTENNNAFMLFSGMLLSMECYANSDVTNFCANVELLKGYYNALTADEKVAFDGSCLKALYDQELERSNFYEKKVSTDDKGNEVISYAYKAVDLGDYEEIFKAIEAETSRLIMVMMCRDYYQLVGLEESLELYAAFFGSYERIRMLSEQILNSGNQDVINAYYYMFDQENSSLYMTVANVRAMATEYLSDLGLDPKAYESEESAALRAFLLEGVDLFWYGATSMYGIPSTGSAFAFSPEAISSLMAKFRAMSADEQVVFSLVMDTTNLYYGALQSYYTGLYSESADNPNPELLKFIQTSLAGEMFYTMYRAYPDGMEQEDGSVLNVGEFFCEYWKEIVVAYNALSDENKALYDETFGEFFAYYTEICESMTSAEE